MLSEKEKNSKSRERGVLILSLFIALFIWFVHNMAKEYPSSFQYVVEIHTNLPGYAETARSEDILFARGHSTGFNLMYHRVGRKAELISLNLDPKYLVQESDNLFALNPDDVLYLIAETVKNDVTIESVQSQPLRFQIPTENCKTVPVEVNAYVTFRDQYMQTGPLTTTPDSVVVYAKPEVLSHIECIRTNLIRVSSADAPHVGTVKLEQMENVRISASEVAWTLPVSRYAEHSFELPVNVTGVPDDKRLIVLPSRVTVTFRSLFSDRLDSSDLSVSVDYSDFLRSNTKKVVPHFIDGGHELFKVSVEPRLVDCILTEDKQ